jgi:hypothetical protein
MDPAKAETYFEKGRAAVAERDKTREAPDEHKASDPVYQALTGEIEAKRAACGAGSRART